MYQVSDCIGQNLFPVKIENALTVHPAIREAVAVAVPDPKYGEVVGAWIVRHPGKHISAEEVRRCVTETMNPQVRPFASNLSPHHLGSMLSDYLPEYSGLGMVCRGGGNNPGVTKDGERKSDEACFERLES